MTLKARTGKASGNTISDRRLSASVPEEPRILMICDDPSITLPLTNVLLKAGFIVERVSNLAEGCESAKSGRFQVVVTAPLPKEGSWKRLIEISNHPEHAFAIVLLANNFDLYQWAEALKDGAFDVLDPFYGLPRAAEAARRAFWAASQRAPSPVRKRPISRTRHSS
jgi:DNA-binding NtrC family response regulator